MNNCGRKPSVSLIFFIKDGEIRRISTEIIHYSLFISRLRRLHYSLAVYRSPTDKLQFDFLYPSFSVRIFRTKTLTNALCCAMMETKGVFSIMGVWLLLIPTEDTVFIEPVTGLDEEEPIQVVHRRALFFSPKPLTIHPKRGIMKSGVFCSQP